MSSSVVLIIHTLLGGHVHSPSLALSLQPLAAVTYEMPPPVPAVFESLGPRFVPDLEGCGIFRWWSLA